LPAARNIAVLHNPNDPFAHALWSKALEAQGKLVLASELAEKAEALLGGGDISRRQDMNMRDFASTAAVGAVLSLGLSVKGGAHEPAGTFTEVTPLGQEVNSPFHDSIAFESGDGLTLAFSSYRPGGSGYSDMYIADRPDTGQDFTEVRNIAELNTFEPDYANFLSGDGLTLYFTTNFPLPGFVGAYDLYFSKRPSRVDPFGEPQPVAGINSEAGDFGISLTADGLEAYFSSLRPGGKGGVDIWVARRSSVDEEEPFVVFRNVEEVNTARWESVPSISADGLTLFWSDHFFDVGNGSRPVRSGGSGMTDIWFASRASRQDPFGKTVNLGSPINTGSHDSWTRVSPRWPEDGSIIYFGRCVNCNLNPDIRLEADIYQATWRVTPRIFLRGEANGDGTLDLSDAVFIFGFLFLGTVELGCREALDANDDGAIDLSDAIGVLGHLFLGSPPTLPGMGVCEPLDASATFGCETTSGVCIGAG
jgi:hypothetical protein